MEKLKGGWYRIGNSGYKINFRYMWLFGCEVFTVMILAMYAFIKVLQMIF